MAGETTAGNHPPNLLDVALGLRVRELRRSLGISQATLGDAVGLTFQQIQKYERGSNRISFSRLVEIAHALGCRAEDLIGDLDDASQPSPLIRQDTGDLRARGAPDLLRAYATVPRPIKRAILKLVTDIAVDQAKRNRAARPNG
jgi:transcriptional regulator with XRE-family HTH domain